MRPVMKMPCECGKELLIEGLKQELGSEVTATCDCGLLTKITMVKAWNNLTSSYFLAAQLETIKAS